MTTTLRHLDISGNCLEALNGVQDLRNLTWLDASLNSLQVSDCDNSSLGASDWSSASHHQVCLLRQNCLCMQSAEQLMKLDKLQVLSLANNHLTHLDGLEGTLASFHS